MPEAAGRDGSPKPPSKPVTRSSLRQSLNLASVGKAIIAGVRSKEAPSDEPKVSKKSKDASRRISVTPQPPAAPRASIGGEPRPTPKSKKADAAPEAKAVTRRRLSMQPARSSSDEMKPSENNATPTGPTTGVTTRGSSLRPKNASATSALPKLRSRATVAEANATVKPASPAPSAKAGARRRVSSSSSEEGGKEQRKPEASPGVAAAERSTRPISPLPQRAALKASSAANAAPSIPTTPSTPTKLKPPSPTVHRNGSPTRPTKLMKTATTASASAKNGPRTPTAKSSGATPRTPRSTSAGSALKAALTRSAQDKTKTGSTPLSGSPLTPSRDSPSPLARHSRQKSKSTKSATSSSFSSSNLGTLSISEESDSDEEDVQLLLAPTANLTAATPAMPRIQRTARRRIAQQPETPSRDKLTARPTLLMPPSSKHNNSSSLRPPKPMNDRSASARVSILSWEHASLSASQHLGPGEADKMLCDVPAPFSGPTSPTTSHIDIPPSPSLSAMDSPALGFGSISQVLLPDVTPSPAPNLSAGRFSVTPEAAGDSSAVYLRLQLAAAEELATQRMHNIMAMEEEIHNLKHAHLQQMEEVARQMAHMEKQDRDQQAGYVAALEEQVRGLRVKAEQEVEAVRLQKEEEARKMKETALRAQRRKMDAVYGSVLAGTAWGSVRDAAEVELDSVRGERQVLSLFLMELEAMTINPL